MTCIDLAPLGRLRPVRTILLGTVFAGALAGGALAETLTVNDIVWPESPLYDVTIPSVEIVDGNVDEAGVRAMFSGSPGAWETLATLDAASVTIPEITITSSPTGEKAGLASYTYRDIVLTRVVDGVAASATVAATEFSSAETVTGTFGEMTVSDFDVGGLLGFYGLNTPATGVPSTEFKQIYSDFTFVGGTLGSPDLFSCTFGAASAGGFSARPLKMNMNDLQALVLEAEKAQEEGTEFPPEKIKQLVLFYTDMLTAFSTTPMSFDGFDCNGKDDKGQPLTIAAGTMTAGAFEPAIYPEFALNDFRVEVPGEGHVTLGNFTWKQMDFSTAIEILEAAAVMDEEFFAANWRRLIPAMDGFSFAALDIDVPNPDLDGQRSVATVGAFDATLGNYINGIPADIAFSLANLVLPITEDMKDVPIADLKARGITSFDISLGTDLAWDEATSTIEVSDVLIDFGSLGRINLSGTFGNATATLFADDTEEATMAAMAITLKDVTISIEDRGIASILVATGAKEAGQPEESFRTAMAGMAQGMTLAFLGNSTEALTAAQQLGLFLQGASNLTMTITAKDEAGIGLADLAEAETNPAALAGKLTIVAEASGEAVTLPIVEDGPSIQDQKRDLKAPATN